MIRRGGWAWGLALAVLLAGCGAERLPPTAGADRFCALRGGDPPAVPREPVTQADFARLAALGYSPAATRAAEAVGVVPLLVRLHQTRDEGARLIDRQQLAEHILQGVLDASGTIAQIDCEVTRGDKLRSRLQGVEERRAQRLGVASLLLGAGTAALTGGLSLAGATAAGNTAGIVGGAAQAVPAGALLFGAAPEVPLDTPRNLLAEVWARPADSQLMPGSVWAYLSHRDALGSSALDQLIAEWRTPELLGAPGSAEARGNAAVLFGASGFYTPRLLEVRDRMLELLGASIALLHRDLRTLLREERGKMLGMPRAAGAAARPRR